MKELVELLAKALVDQPEAVQVTQKETDKEVLLELRVAPEDMGKVIGKQGKIAKAIRTMVKAAAAKDGRRVTVEII
ncbi:KH domain-containing protein [Heliorestis acidaminivorans]|uniref:RNA-binding protein KhpA n=1 Tax=Heliorestis acidaminivorans TaxID=553427 RepID=A0A6I0F354_9FIRM|nr:KH domain-containing protein [Heliorestis acidaminivorans]KAB2954431.1 KH domain-containing protein [Heliorestis acidaminivorans]